MTAPARIRRLAAQLATLPTHPKATPLFVCGGWAVSVPRTDETVAALGRHGFVALVGEDIVLVFAGPTPDRTED